MHGRVGATKKASVDFVELAVSSFVLKSKISGPLGSHHFRICPRAEMINSSVLRFGF